MRKLIFNLHLYTALVAGIFVLILAVTGSIMAFEDDLDRMLHPSLFTVQPGLSRRPIGQILTALRTAFPAEKFNGLHVGSRRDESYYTSISGGQVFVDPYTVRILGTRRTPTTLQTIHELHLRLLLGRKGGTIVVTVGFLLVWLVLSGIYLWWPLKRASIKFPASLRRVAFDLHHTAGIYSALLLLTAGVTGIVIHWDGKIGDWLNRAAHAQAPLRMVPSRFIAGLEPINPTTAIVAARVALPGTEPLYYNGPSGPTGSYFVAMHYPEDLTTGGRSWVVVDQYTAQALFVESSRMAPAGSWAIMQNRAIHTGDIGGYPTKILMTISCLLLIVQAVTGYILWMKKVRPGSRDYL